MTTDRLWDILEPQTDKKSLIIKDFSEGITPELPYFVVGQSDVKSKITQYIQEIDSNYFNRSLLVSDYGNGKTNILKYLELYFNTVDSPVKYIYEVANIDKPDIFSMILELLEFQCKDDIKNAIKISQEDQDFIAEEKSKYTFIQEYVNIIFSQKDDSEIDELIYMGTGRYYTKKIFSDHGIPPLTDMHRREVLEFFLNLLSKNKTYILFAVDELEKLYEKSKARFRNFLTTFRELIDISSKINGHYFIGAMVTSIAHFTYSLEENPAFYSRINKDILHVNFLSLSSDREELIENSVAMIGTKLSALKKQEILAKITEKFGKENPLKSNRYMIQEIFSLLREDGRKTYKELNIILEEKDLHYEFEDLKLELMASGVFKRIKEKFFDAIKYYFTLKDQEIKQIQGYEYLYCQRKTPICRYFVFSEDQFNKDKSFLDELLINNKIIYIFYNQEQHNIKHEQFDKEVKLINYNVETLLTLFIFLEEEMQYQEDIQEIIEHYTKSSL